MGFRVGTTRTYTEGATKACLGPVRRLHAGARRRDVGRRACTTTEAESRFARGVARSAIRAADAAVRRSPAPQSDPAEQPASGTRSSSIGCSSSSTPTKRGAAAARRPRASSFEHPHHLPRLDDADPSGAAASSSVGRAVRRPPRRATPMHRISLFGYDDEGREALESIGLSVRPARKGSPRLAVRDVQRRHGRRRRHRCGASVGASTCRCVRSPASRPTTTCVANSLPFLPASSVRRGMVMVDEHGDVRRRDRRRVGRARGPGVRPRHRAHPQLRGRGPGHPQLDLQVPRGGLPEPGEVRGGVPRGDGHRHGAELPLQPAHPRRRQRGHRQQRGAPAEAPVDRADRRRAHHPLPRRGRARRGCVRRARDRPARRHRAPPLRRRRRLLPHQRAEPRRSRRRSCVRACPTASSAA